MARLIMNSDLLRTFIAVATQNNVTHAAQLLHKTQSTISVQIKRLEESLDVKLFERGARGVELTGAGETLLRSALPIIEQLDQTKALFSGQQIGGQVRVGIPDEYGETILPGILAGFARLYRNVEVSVRCEFSVNFPQAIQRGELDIALFACQQPQANDEVLRVEKTVWAGCSGNLFSSDEPLPLALFERSCWWREIALETLDSAGIPYRIAYTSQSVAGVKAAISAGLAVGILAESSLDESVCRLKSTAGLFPALPDSGLVMLQADKNPSAAVVAMAQALRQGFGKE